VDMSSLNGPTVLENPRNTVRSDIFEQRTWGDWVPVVNGVVRRLANTGRISARAVYVN